MPVRNPIANGEKIFFKQKAKKKAANFIDTADKVMIPVAFCF